MSGLDIAKLEQEVALVQRMVFSDEDNLAASEYPIVDRIFLSSSSKLLHDLQRQLHEAKAERAFEVVRFRLIGSQMEGSIRLRSLVKLVTPLNQLLEHCSWRVWDKDGDGTKMDDTFTSLLDLRLAGIHTGSTELVIMGNTAPDLTGISALQDGLKNLFSMLRASTEEIPEIINEVGISAAKAAGTLLSELERHSIAAELHWNAPGNPLYWEGRPAEISRIKAVLEEIGEPVTELITIRGTVQVLSVRSKIEIRDTREDPPKKVVASYHHSLLEEVQELRLGDRRDFLIERTTYPLSMSRKKRNAYRLKSIDLCDPNKESIKN